MNDNKCIPRAYRIPPIYHSVTARLRHKTQDLKELTKNQNEFNYISNSHSATCLSFYPRAQGGGEGGEGPSAAKRAHVGCEFREIPPLPIRSLSLKSGPLNYTKLT